jgi:hypothetical protein
MFLANNGLFSTMNKDLIRKLTSLKWGAKNTYFIMPARRVFGGLVRHFSGGPGPIQKNI